MTNWPVPLVFVFVPRGSVFFFPPFFFSLAWPGARVFGVTGEVTLLLWRSMVAPVSPDPVCIESTDTEYKRRELLG